MVVNGKRVLWVSEKKILLDREGFLKDPSLWSEEVAEVMARESGLDFLDEHQWQALHFMRDYYKREGKVPLNHKIKQGTGLGMMELEGMFPGGIRYGLRRLAGLPNVKGCGGGSA